MSDSDSNNIVIPDDVFPLPSVVCNLSKILNAEVHRDIVIPRKSKRDDTQTTTSVRILETTLSMGFMKTKTCTKPVEMAQMILLLISKLFTTTVEVTSEHLVQLSASFAHTGFHNK